MRSQLKKIEDLGAAMEEALILDNKYTEHSTVGLAQQWDQLDQLGMRMQHNLEQQIQARWGGTCPAWNGGLALQEMVGWEVSQLPDFAGGRRVPDSSLKGVTQIPGGFPNETQTCKAYFSPPPFKEVYFPPAK